MGARGAGFISKIWRLLVNFKTLTSRVAQFYWQHSNLSVISFLLFLVDFSCICQNLLNQKPDAKNSHESEKLISI